MDQTLGVGVVECLGDGRDQFGGRGESEPFATNPRRQITPLDKLGDDKAEAVRRAAQVVNRHDMGMLEPGEDPRLPQIGLDILVATDRSGLGTLIATGRSRSSSWAR